MQKIQLTTVACVLAAGYSVPTQTAGTAGAVQPGSPRAVRVEALVNAPVKQVWRVWTTSVGAQEFFAEKANIRLAIGGPYEIQFDPKDEHSGTKGLKILAYTPEEMIAFQWNAPPQFPHVRDGATWVVVQMRPEGANGTWVTLQHLGWQDGPEWDAALVHFERGWSELMKRLQRRFEEGPVDWTKERMMYQEVKERGRTH